MFTLYIVVENKKKTRPTYKLITKDLRKKFKNTNSLVGLCYGHLSITSGKDLYSVQDSQKQSAGFPHYARIVCATTLAYGKRVL